MTGAPQPHRPAPLPEDEYVLPTHIAAAGPHRGPRFGDMAWELRDFLPRSARRHRIDFTRLPDDIAVRTAKEYLHSRLHRVIPAAGHSAAAATRLKLSAAVQEFYVFSSVLRALRAAGAERLSQVRQPHLDAALAGWTAVESCAIYVALLRHLADHGPFLSQDRLGVYPWPGRPSNQVAGCILDRSENRTPRIPENISSPLIKAAAFYVLTGGHDILAARRELLALEDGRRTRQENAQFGEVKARLQAFIAQRRRDGRGIPALPRVLLPTRPGARVVDGVVQAPNIRLLGLLLGVNERSGARYLDLITAAAAEIGYEEGGTDTPMSAWPETGRPWRSRLSPETLQNEITQLRTACWIVVAYLSGMRAQEILELRRDCAFTETTDDGHTRYKLRGRVFKDRRLAGDETEWVVLEPVHQAVKILLELNDDPTHLFGYHRGDYKGYALPSVMPRRLAKFRDHLNTLFSTDEAPFVPSAVPDLTSQDPDARGDPGTPWAFTPRQFRRTLAWHIAHQPFGVVAGAKQYKHAKIAMFDGYAGTSASGFASEVAAEESMARLDYAEELYRDWNDGGRAAGGATTRVDAELTRIRRELGDLPGVIASPIRLRTMLGHLTKTLHPGVLNDCFYQPAAAACAKRAPHAQRPLPLLDSCSTCPNARRSTVHLPRLTVARDQATTLLPPEKTPMPPLQRAALNQHIDTLTSLITEIAEIADLQDEPA